jgi:diacylglycerol kinase family enzyme
MRITLIHNPKAGHGKHKTKELIDALAKSGYHATYRSTKKTAYKKTLEPAANLKGLKGMRG